MARNISISNLSVLLSEGSDFFKINAECSVDNCSILILVFVILMGTLVSIGLFIIIRRIRSRNSRIYVQVRAVKVKNIEKELQNQENCQNESMDFYDLNNNVINNTTCKSENLKNVSLFKILPEESNRKNSSTISTGKPKDNENYQKELKENCIMLKVDHKKNYPNNNESGSSKSSKKNYFNEKLENKLQMFGDDSSIQYEDDSFNHNDIFQQNPVFDLETNMEEKSKEITCSVHAYLKDSYAANAELEKQNENVSEIKILKNNESVEFKDSRLKTILEENEGNNDTLRNVTIEKI